MRTPLVVILVVLAGLVAITAARGDWSGDAAAGPALTPVRTVAKRVQTLRGLRFDTLPKPVYVTGATARREAAADTARPEAARALDAETALETLLGLVPPRTDLREVSAQVFQDAVAGYYDPRDGRLRIVRSALTANPVLGETTVAHELTHALDDQAIGLRTDDLDAAGDAAAAYTALVEGTATELMTAYQARYVSLEDTLGASLSGVTGDTGTEGLPPFVVASLLFPYLDGQRFVSALRDAAGGSWGLVDQAERDRPPASTEQVLHPRKWIAPNPPLPVRVRDPGPALGPGARRLTAGTFGEWQTRQLLGTGAAGGAGDAAAGWGGDRYVLWRDGTGPCATPCVGRDTLVMRWRWDTPRDAREFAAALREAVPELLDATPAGRDRWRSRGGAVAVADRAGKQTLVLAPTAARAAAVLRATA